MVNIFNSSSRSFIIAVTIWIFCCVGVVVLAFITEGWGWLIPENGFTIKLDTDISFLATGYIFLVGMCIWMFFKGLHHNKKPKKGEQRVLFK